MASSATWNLLLDTVAAPDTQVTDMAVQAVTSLLFLGSGLIHPFQRDEKADFAHTTGARLVKSAVSQVLGTRCSSATAIGELPWRPEFGSLLSVLRHANNNDELKQVAAGFVVDALRRWEPRVSVTGFDIQKRSTAGQDDTIEVIVQYNIIDRNVAGNNVIVSGQQATVEFEVGVQ